MSQSISKAKTCAECRHSNGKTLYRYCKVFNTYVLVARKYNCGIDNPKYFEPKPPTSWDKFVDKFMELVFPHKK